MPLGLLGEARKTALVLAVIAVTIASTLSSKFSSLGTEMASPPQMSAVKEYMPKVGDGMMMFSPGPRNMRSSRSMSSSLPLPATIRSSGAPRYLDRMLLSLRCSGSV